MASFQYKAVDAGGALTTGFVDAEGEPQAIEQLRARGLIPLGLERGQAVAQTQRRQLFQSKKVSQEQVMAMTRDLSNLLNAGLSLDRSLEILIGLADTPAQQMLLQSVRDEVRGGASLSQALERRPALFSRLFSNMVKAGEASGALGAVLQRLTEFQERAKELKDTVKAALTYPSIVLIAAVGSIVLLIMVVLPQFDAMFKDSKKALPTITETVLNTGKWLRAWWWTLPIGGFALWALIKARLNTTRGRFKWDARKLTLPLFGELTQKIEVARLARTLSTLLKAGVNLLPALSIVKDTVTNTVLAASLDGVIAKLREGRGFSTPLMETGLYPKLAVHMVKVGEETGKLPDMLGNVADIYDREVQHSVKRMVTLIEPILIIGLAVVVGGMIGSVLLGLMSVSDLSL